MAITTTANLLLPYPDGTELVSLGPTDFKNIAQILDGTGGTATRLLSGTLVSRPSANTVPVGTIYQATDAGVSSLAIRGQDSQWHALAVDTAGVPIGGSIDYWGTNTTSNPVDPDGQVRWLLCNGQAVSRTTYAALFALIGTSQGAGDGSTTFNVPNEIGMVTAGAGTRTGYTSRTVGSTVYGAETHALTVAELASHGHTASSSASSSTSVAAASIGNGNHGHSAASTASQGFFNGSLINGQVQLGTGYPAVQASGIEGIGIVVGASGPIITDPHGHSASTSTTVSTSVAANGSGTAHNIMQPTLACNKIIRAL